MTSNKKFVFKVFGASLLLILGVVSINVYINEFGLFGNVKGKEYRVHTYEKTTKYLFSYNYIPEKSTITVSTTSQWTGETSPN